ncbi:MAG: hypothetical protein H6754_02195 [Candidatus Omnitrophica bacterium]|nr:hypothetical protein [Candidatus Omnitrophota bacterium]
MKMMCVKIFGLVAILGFATAALSQPAVVPHFYGIERGMIQYEISGSSTGTETLYFDQWGMRQVRIKSEETQRWGVNNTVTFNFAEKIIIIDPNKNLGQKLEDADLKKFLLSHTPDDSGLIAMQFAEFMGGTKVKNENILERPCELWDIKNLKLKNSFWKGIPLKIEVQTVEGTVNYKAVKIDETIVVDEAMFTIPESVRFIDMDIKQILISLRTSDGF